MKKISNLLLRIYHIRALKFIVASVIAVVLVGFVDENSVLKHIRNKQYISELQSEIDHYTDQYQRDQEKIHELESNPKAITKIARERYFMKAEDEDIFVLSTDPKRRTAEDETAE